MIATDLRIASVLVCRNTKLASKSRTSIKVLPHVPPYCNMCFLSAEYLTIQQCSMIRSEVPQLSPSIRYTPLA